MTNTERAARTVWEASRGVGEPLSAIASDHIAAALADAGLLMPDLPEPVADEVGELEWGGIARWEPDGSLQVTDDLYGETSPHYLRATALAMLAAANYAERNQA